MSEEKKIEYLWNAAGSLRPVNHTKKLLKSYYLTIARKIARYTFILPNDKFGDIEMCAKCSANWFDGNFSLKLVSAKIHSSKAKRLVENLESGKNLTKKQKIRAKWYRKKIFSFLQFKCKLCEHKTNVRLIKPAKDEDKSTVVPEEIPTKKQKKKKKEKFAGLKIENILKKSEKSKTEIPSKPKKAITEFIKCDIQSTSEGVPAKTVVIKPKVQPKFNIIAKMPPANKLKKIESKSLNIKKSKNKKTKVTQNQVISKTQQKNTILQLAQMLKQNGNGNTKNQNNKSDNRLKNLLR